MVVTNTVNQDYAGYSETVTDKLVVIDVSEIIGEAIRYMRIISDLTQSKSDFFRRNHYGESVRAIL